MVDESTRNLIAFAVIVTVIGVALSSGSFFSVFPPDFGCNAEGMSVDKDNLEVTLGCPARWTGEEIVERGGAVAAIEPNKIDDMPGGVYQVLDEAGVKFVTRDGSANTLENTDLSDLQDFQGLSEAGSCEIRWSGVEEVTGDDIPVEISIVAEGSIESSGNGFRFLCRQGEIVEVDCDKCGSLGIDPINALGFQRESEPVTAVYKFERPDTGTDSGSTGGEEPTSEPVSESTFLEQIVDFFTGVLRSIGNLFV